MTKINWYFFNGFIFGLLSLNSNFGIFTTKDFVLGGVFGTMSLLAVGISDILSAIKDNRPSLVVGGR